MVEALAEQCELEESTAEAVGGHTQTTPPTTSAVREKSPLQQRTDRPVAPNAPKLRTPILNPPGFTSGDASAASQRDARATNTSQTTRRSKAPAAKVKYVRQAQLDAEEARLRTLSDAVLSGDKSALDQLRTALDNCPYIWRRLADLQQMIESKMAALLAERDPLLLEAFRKRCSEIRQIVVGDSQLMVVKLAASRVIACWTFAQFLELRGLDENNPWIAKHLLQAERRLEAAMRSFALAKRLEQQLAVASE